MKNKTKVLKELEKKGWTEIQSGIYLSTREQIMTEQEDWEDLDSSKDEDFTTSEYWITTDNGADAEGFDTVDEALATIEG